MLIGKGVVAFNIIPDRNWNVPDPEVRRMKVQNLYRVVELAQKLDLPLNIGTEMNSYGQKLADDLDAPELAPLRELFLDGAYFIYGHTRMQRALGLGYQVNGLRPTSRCAANATLLYSDRPPHTAWASWGRPTREAYVCPVAGRDVEKFNLISLIEALN